MWRTADGLQERAPNKERLVTRDASVKSKQKTIKRLKEFEAEGTYKKRK
jgi:hypothetical protein